MTINYCQVGGKGVAILGCVVVVGIEAMGILIFIVRKVLD